jgi:hypothetical protein
LLRAGVNRTLAERGFEVLGPLGFRSASAPPQDAPNVYTYAALRALSELVTGTAQPVDPSLQLGDVLGGLSRGNDSYGFLQPRVVIFDQFEELFTTHLDRWPHREDFLHQVADALERDPELRVVFSMREEYIAQLDRYASLLPDAVRARFHLERLGEASAIAAVKGPLKLEGIEFDAGVAETLVRDLQETRVDLGERTARVEGEFVEPVQLQVVCRTLWQHLDSGARRVTADDLASLGNVDDSLVDYYSDAVAAAVARTSVAEHKLRDELERSLITSAGTRATLFAGDRETTVLPVAALDELADRHLIRAEWRAGGRWLELAHDRLIEPIQRSNELVRARCRRRRLRRRAIGGMVLLIGLLAGVLALASIWFGKTTVPEVVGARSVFEAKNRLASAGLTVGGVESTNTQRLSPGTVIGQSRAPGETVDKGSQVSLEIAVSSALTTVPNLLGLDLPAANRRLRKAGLQKGVLSSSSPKAKVASQIPSAGEIVKAGTPVDIFLSR